MAAFSVTGMAEVLKATSKAKSDMSINIKEGLTKCIGVVGRKADKYVPRETGDLAASKVEEVTGVGMGARAKLEYGGPSAPYALYVHEDLTKHHAEPTCAQWLTRASRETRGTCTSIMERQISDQTRAFKDGVNVTDFDE